ncbi:PEP/pyruvate-binding domain-containing protein [Pseudonocardia sp. TRM90224]|uniref:PEP/pyruvate-binding domain-containing protein n=1 Tax=Pseudonocardia sp. TRM90224 TaxID=2812678 RepID=UPI001E2CB339|nr:PEP/pyruvate-binding domain-containing protein [Pseudonocardia sp. TRM90224]
MTTTQATVIGLDAPDARRLGLVGGKAANLAELISAGFTVPGGFCVATAAYAQAATAAGLDAVLADPDDLAARARAALLAVEVPAGVAAAVTAAYAGLGTDVPVAVRSSATAEDLPTASFAGQQDTYLNVVGTDAVLDAVRRCWASLWTDRAVSYRETAGIDHQGVQLAVVVQRMVDVDVAGVLFTADPVSGRRTRTVIDASPGLGEAVVSGAVNPDHIVVDGAGDIVEHRVGDKAVAIRALPGGGTEHVARTGAAEPALTDAQIVRLVALGRKVEAHYGAPQDIEWALAADGTLWLTQSRAITTLHPIPASTRPGMRAFLCVSLAQGLTRPMTPMGIAAFRVIASTGSRLAFGVPVPDPHVGPPALAEAGGRLFIDATAALRNPVGSRIVPQIFDVMESRSAVVMRELMRDPAFAVQGRSPLPFLRRLVRMLVRFRIPALIALALARPATARDRVDRIGERMRAHTAPPPGNATARERLDHAERVLSTTFPVLPRVVPVAGAGFLMLGLAQKLAGKALDAGSMHEVLRSLPHNSTTEMDLELWAAATRIGADAESAAALRDTPAAELAAAPELPAVLARELAAFLREHGHRAVAEIDLGMPRWADDPTQVLGVLANYLRLDDPERHPDVQFARGAQAAQRAVADVVARVPGRLRAAAVRAVLGRMRELAGMRETHKDYLVYMIAQARAQLAIVGAELAAGGLLARPDDVFFLELPEVRDALDGADHRVAVAERRADYARELRRRHIPRVLLSDGTEPETLVTPEAVEGAMVGTPASAGTATAPARVVLDPVGAHLEPGEILVCPSTDPGWTPLFLTAGGLVMEMGGPNSHGAVVAREYGIPAVVGVPDATLLISTGEQVTVDGAAGLVRKELA